MRQSIESSTKHKNYTERAKEKRKRAERVSKTVAIFKQLSKFRLLRNHTPLISPISDLHSNTHHHQHRTHITTSTDPLPSTLHSTTWLTSIQNTDFRMTSSKKSPLLVFQKHSPKTFYFSIKHGCNSKFGLRVVLMGGEFDGILCITLAPFGGEYRLFLFLCVCTGTTQLNGLDA